MATNWTEEQKLAIYEDGQNIIVSAGAGSGKTAVLSERVLEKLKNGIHVNELLVMTFTNAAAAEMKERIRKKIMKEESLKEELELLDSAYITTFDSFALSIVKKYHDVINVTRSIKICDGAIVTIKTNEILDEIMDEYYESNDEKFLSLINDFCLKDDNELKNSILKVFDSISLKYDPLEYLNNEVLNSFSDEKVEKRIIEYIDILKINIKEIKRVLKKLSLAFDSDYMDKLYNSLNPLLNANTYEEIKKSLDIKLPRVPKNTDEEVKNLKSTITDFTGAIKKLCIYEDTNEMKEEILSTKQNTEVISDILKKLVIRLDEYKKKENMYDFNDVFHMAIKIVMEHKEVREELKEEFKEILVDEYQDTSDLQELFISLIEDDNVYMVGDIKQSIYRFRNANPYIFKNKYDNYATNNGGMKIDLNKNFRSRREVLSNINIIFDSLMSDDFGGASYKESHRMRFGNMTYENEGSTSQNYNIKIKTYEDEESFSKGIKEAFIIAKDIKTRVKNKDKAFIDGTLRKIKYKDFAILIDKSKDFDLFKKVLDYFEIPSAILKDSELTKEDDILILKNLFKLVLLIHNKKFNEEFKYSFLSIGRSFLFNLEDEELFSYFVNKNFDESIIYEKCKELSKNLDEKTASTLLEEIIDVFNYEEKLITLVNIKEMRVRLEYISNLVKDFESFGNTIEDFIEYLDTVFNTELRLNFGTKQEDGDAVKIMTIHKSKGLEFPVCYFAGFTYEFNLRDLNDKILYNNEYGIVLPKVSDIIKTTIIKELLKENTKKEEISEKIRLLYVALTRAKEEMVIVCPQFERELELSHHTKMKYKSFYNMLESVVPIIEDYIETVVVEPTNDFLYSSNKTYLEEKKTYDFVVEELNIENNEKKEERFSKLSLSLDTKEEKRKKEIGTKFHQILELLDFKNPNLNIYNDKEKRLIENFLNQPLIKESIKDANIYHEYEFIFCKEDVQYHGIIDLMIELSDKIIIIDYKLKNIDDDKYIDQLNGYKNAIEEKTKKEVSTYLYSIIDNRFKEV